MTTRLSAQVASPRRAGPTLLIALAASLVAMSTLRAQPVRAPRGVVDSFPIRSTRYPWTRRVWVYTPAGYRRDDPTLYPLLVAFDGSDYVDSAGMALPRMLDSLIAAKRIPPLIAVLVDDSSFAVRTGELGNSERFADFLTDELVPRVRSGWRVTHDPRRTIITGSSAGGLGAAFVALRRPELFGNVLSQSGAFWRGPEGKSEPYEWLTARVAEWPKRDVRFLVDVGSLETIHVLGGSGPSFIDATRRFRDALLKRGYVVRYAEVAGGHHAPDTWRARLPGDLETMAGEWR